MSFQEQSAVHDFEAISNYFKRMSIREQMLDNRIEDEELNFDETSLMNISDSGAIHSEMNETLGNSNGLPEIREENRPYALDADARSVWIGNVDYNATKEGLQNHFSACGTVQRVTILKDDNTGRPRGYAYVEFADIDSVMAALAVNQTFCGRKLKIASKRTNRPGISIATRNSHIRSSNPLKILPNFKTRSWSRKTPYFRY